jgi:hypothetical protein
MVQDLGIDYDAEILGRTFRRRGDQAGIVGLSEMTAGERLETFRAMAGCWNDE